jgi:CHAT domain-containing protein
LDIRQSAFTTTAEALRESVLSMIEKAESDYDAHPRFWAPFVVVGEPARQ